MAPGLRDRLLVLVDELWDEAQTATMNRSRVESRILRETANRLLGVLGQPERVWTPPEETPPSYKALIESPS